MAKINKNNYDYAQDLPSVTKIVKTRTHNNKPDIKRSKPNHRKNE